MKIEFDLGRNENDEIHCLFCGLKKCEYNIICNFNIVGGIHEVCKIRHNNVKKGASGLYSIIKDENG